MTALSIAVVAKDYKEFVALVKKDLTQRGFQDYPLKAIAGTVRVSTDPATYYFYVNNFENAHLLKDLHLADVLIRDHAVKDLDDLHDYLTSKNKYEKLD